MDFSNLDTPTLDEAIRSDREAIRNGENFLKSLTGRENLGLRKMAEAIPQLLEKLEAELRELEEERSKRS